ncbi:MAG: peptidoglycan DD-metalloendopeptidase family protein [Falsihalocynthiibacter arcticus]|uniref:murein hydrolase activator EnvC family protein n=1 Tax=Falsihalocynthiibacter sp. CO-5D18 TaxID=3240872 RepID=UPI00350FF33C
MKTLRIIGCLLTLGMATPSMAEVDPSHAARRAAQQISTATLALDDAKSASDRVAALTEAVQAFEAGLEAMREGLRRATIREQAIALEFEARREEVAQLIGVLQSMESSPTPLLLLHPSGPLGTARSGMILSDVTPSLQANAEELRARLQEVALLRSLQESAVQSLQEGLFGAQDARTELSLAISDRTDLPRRFVEDPERLQSLLEGSETLEAFATGLVQGVDAAPLVIMDFEAMQGNLNLPVLGRVLRKYDEADASGIRRPGFLIAANPLSVVTSPAPATIRYRGPLLDYGNVIILEPQAGYLLVIAGLSEVYGEVGQVVLTGDPLGLMGGNAPQAQEFLQKTRNGSGASRSETLYMELRQGKSTLDPAPWFAVTKE